MTFNVQNLASSLSKQGIAKSSHFEVQLTGPYGLDAERDMMYRADSVSLPGRSITTTEHKFDNYGPVNKVAYGQVYSDLAVTFILSEDMREKEYFEVWQDKMVGTGAFTQSNSRFSNATFNTKYFDNYAGVITIRQYGSAGELRSIHTLVEAYPIMLGDVQMSWGDDQPARLSVTFAYKYYRTVFNKQDQPGLGFGFGFKIGRNGLSGNLRVPGLGNFNADTALRVLNADIGGLPFAKIRSSLPF
jgi:hypothetical protein